MAKDISDALVKDIYVFPNHPFLHLKVKTRKFRKAFRNLLVKVLPLPKFPKQVASPVITDEFETDRELLKTDTYGYCNKVWSDEFHQQLVEQWPSDRFFDPIRFVTKSYDYGMMWSNEMDGDPDHLSDFPAYKAAYDYFRSEEFCKRVTDLVGDGIERKPSHVLLTRSYTGSSIIPHIDSANVEGNFNFVIYVNASEGQLSGSLGFWKDNEFKELIFEADKLKNTGVYYKMDHKIYHGFAPMRKGAFRWTINATYEKK